MLTNEQGLLTSAVVNTGVISSSERTYIQVRDRTVMNARISMPETTEIVMPWKQEMQGEQWKSVFMYKKQRREMN